MKLPLIALTEFEGDQPYSFSHLCLFKKCDLDRGSGMSYCQRHPEGCLTPDRKNTALLTFFLYIFSHLLIFNSFIIHFIYSRIFLSVEDNRAVAFNRRTFHGQKCDLCAKICVCKYADFISLFSSHWTTTT